MSYTADEYSCHNCEKTNPELCIIVGEGDQRESQLPLFPRRCEPLVSDSPRQKLRTRLGLPDLSSIETNSPEVLFADFFSEQWATRLRAVRRVSALWEEIPDRVKGALIQALRDDSMYVRAAAIRELAQLREQAPIELLLQAVADLHWQVRAAAISTLVKLGVSVPVEPLRRCLVDDEPVVQEIALHALSDLGELRLRPDLAQALGAEDPRVRLAAIQLLQNWPGSEAFSELLERVFDIDEEVRYEALNVLSRREELVSGDLLLAILQDQQEDIRVRLKALQILQRREGPLPLEPLLLSLKDPNQQIRDCVSRLLGQHDLEIPHSVSSEALLRLLQDESEDLRAVAAWALGEQRAYEAESALLKAKEDSSELVHLAAEQALGLLEEVRLHREDTPALGYNVREEQASLQDAGVQFLASLVEYLQDKYGEVRQERQRTTSGSVLILSCRFHSNKDDFQDTVLDTLAENTPIESIERALQSQDEIVRAVATRESKCLREKAWSEMFIASLELLQDTRVQMEEDVPVKIVFCSVGLAPGTERIAPVPVLDEIVEVFQREAICEYSHRVCSRHGPIGGVTEQNRQKNVSWSSQLRFSTKPNSVSVGKTLKNIQAWYEARQILCL